MKALLLVCALAIQEAQSGGTDLWQECQIERATYCDMAGCRGVEPTIKLYIGDYAGPGGKREGYYYRCRRGALCDIINDPWIGEGGGYRAFVMRDRGVISRISADNHVTDVATIGDTVLISRGRCWAASKPGVALQPGN
jgi:hypothetical protein